MHSYQADNYFLITLFFVTASSKRYQLRAP